MNYCKRMTRIRQHSQIVIMKVDDRHDFATNGDRMLDKGEKHLG